MPKKLLLLVSTSFFISIINCQTQKTFYIGHSLTDNIPEMVKSLSDNHGSVALNWRYQSIPGSSLEYQWTRKDPPNSYTSTPPAFYGFFHPTEGLPAGNFTSLVLTESVPRNTSSIYSIPYTYRYADSFFNYANTLNPNLQVYIYEVWHCLNSGTPTGCAWDVNSNPWRQRLTDDLPMWESVIDTLQVRYNPQVNVCLIPGGQGLARLYDSIQVGAIPGISNINQLFSDDIHLTDVGKYFIACIHFAMLHHTSPVGLTNQLYNVWGGAFTAPTPAQALKFQQIAWLTVNNYPKTCLPNVLDVRFLKASAKKMGGNILIQWNTSADALPHHYIVEKSTDGIKFNSIKTIDGNIVGNNSKNYSCSDYNSPENIIYYRILYQSNNGSKKYSSIIKVNNNSIIITVTPNPATSIVTVNGVAAGKEVRVYNAQGAIILKTKESNISVANWPQGIYFIKTEGETIKFVKK